MIKEPLARAELLKTLLLWGGRLGNARLRELLGMKVTRVSQLISEFHHAHPDWMEWDAISRSYRATPAVYRSKFEAAASLGQYLSLVGITHAKGESSDERTLWNAFPDLSVPTAAHLCPDHRSYRAVPAVADQLPIHGQPQAASARDFTAQRDTRRPPLARPRILCDTAGLSRLCPGTDRLSLFAEQA